MSVSIPACTAVLFFESVTDDHGRTCYCGIQHDLKVAAFPYQLDRWDFHVFIDGSPGQYDITHRVTDAQGNVVGQGVWGRFTHHSAKTTHLLGQPEFTTPPLPQPGVYMISTLLRR